MKKAGNNRGTQPRIGILPPPQPGISKAVQLEVVRLAEFGIGCKLVGRQVGISHTSVLRIWCRHGVSRAKLAKRRAIIEEHRSLAIRIAKSVAHDLPLHMREDLAPVALEKLLKLADAYNPAMGVPFAAYAQKGIRGACIDSIRRRHYVSATSSELSTEASEARADESATVEDSLIEREASAENRTVAVDAVCKLPGRLAVVAWLHYIEQRPIERIAAQLGVGASRVSQLHTEALGLMRVGMRA